ncbi:MAG: hypothetical protein U0174_22835 [Polyangiaceae bacterium]
MNQAYGTIGLALVLVCACSTTSVTPSLDASTTSDAGSLPSDDAATPMDASVDAQGALDAADAAVDSGPLACDTPLSGQLVSVFPSGGNVTGATVSYDGCGGSTTVSAPPSFTLNVSKGASVLRAKLAGFHTSLSAELNPVVLSLPQIPPIPLQLVDDSVLAGYNAQKAHLVVSINAASGNCTKAGNTVSVPGHAEAVVTYINNDGSDAGGASMVASGLAWITNINPGATVTPVITAAGGCKVNTTYTTGAVRLEADTVTMLGVQLAP